MTTAEKQEFEAFKAARAAETKKAREKENREAYKALVNEVVNDVFPAMQELSEELKAMKTDVYQAFQQALVMKAELYNVQADQRSHTFTNADGTRRITLGQYITDGYDDTVNEGIAKVKEFIGSLARDDNSRMLVGAILKLLSRDQQGNLKASRVMQLSKMAQESGNEVFLDGVRIIEAAYRPQVSKYYVRAEYKNGINQWISIPLGITEA